MAEMRTRPGCLVTGAAGFVGSHLAERLLSLGFEVVGVDNFFSGHRGNMASFADHPGFRFYESSVCEHRLLAELRKSHPSLKYCFHLAAIVSVPYSMEHPELTLEVNYRATKTLVEESAKLDFAAFVFAGSAAEYGNEQRLPLREEYASAKTQQLTPYGQAKFLATRCVAEKPFGAALRCFNIYGPRQDPASPYSGVISRFVDLALAEAPLTIYGDGLQTRDFIYVADVVEAYVCAAGLNGKVTLPFSGIYNVATGRCVSVLDLAGTILDLAAAPRSLVFLPERAGDIRYSLAAVESFRMASGWSPQVQLREGLQSTLEWARQAGRHTSS